MLQANEMNWNECRSEKFVNADEAAVVVDQNDYDDDDESVDGCCETACDCLFGLNVAKDDYDDECWQRGRRSCSNENCWENGAAMFDLCYGDAYFVLVVVA